MRKLTILAALAFTALCCAVPAFAADELKTLKIIINDAEGKPIPASSLRTLHTFDMSDEAVLEKVIRRDGEVQVILPVQPVQFSMMLDVPDFGYLVVYADNRGKGYTEPGTIDFVSEAAATRLYRVNKVLKHAEGGKVKLSAELYDKMKRAEMETPYKSLALSLAAGEELTLARARHRIAQLKEPRKSFLFGCNTFGHPARGPEYDRWFKEFFNFGTANMYLTGFAREENAFNYSRTDGEVNWLLSMEMSARTSAPFYMLEATTPEWMKSKRWPEAGKIAHDIMLDVAKHYKGKVVVCEVANEMHDKINSNSLKLDQKQLVEMIKVLSDATREGDPNVKRLINSCNLWGESSATPTKDGQVLRSPYKFLKECIDSGVEFEIVGLQMYYPRYDFFEIERMLDRYAKLGKPIHITEMGCQSQAGVDQTSQRKAGKEAGWHGVWNEEKQADWVEGVYTIFYSKPYVEAVTWWDFADGPSWFDFGGLLKGDCSPKPSFQRLMALKKAWGLTDKTK